MPPLAHQKPSTNNEKSDGVRDQTLDDKAHASRCYEDPSGQG